MHLSMLSRLSNGSGYSPGILEEIAPFAGAHLPGYGGSGDSLFKKAVNCLGFLCSGKAPKRGNSRIFYIFPVSFCRFPIKPEIFVLSGCNWLFLADTVGISCSQKNGAENRGRKMQGLIKGGPVQPACWSRPGYY
jgi:hypothetical protein